MILIAVDYQENLYIVLDGMVDGKQGIETSPGSKSKMNLEELNAGSEMCSAGIHRDDGADLHPAH
jgi:hypothetical protein